MEAQFHRKVSEGLQTLVSYTWSHSIDTGSSDALSRLRGGGVSVGGDISPETIDPGPSDFDVRHVFTAAVTYGLPTPASASDWSLAIRGWSLDAIFRARTATPVNIVTRTAPLDDGFIVELQRPDLIASVPIYLKDSASPGGRRINRDAFRIPAPGKQGNLGYNSLRGFGVSQLDLAIRRTIAVAESVNLQVRAEFFNIFNHPNFGNFNNNLSSSMFGQATQMFGRSLGTGGINGGLSPLYQIGGPRSIQLAVKLIF
jgi:hypothetical protein